MNSLAVTCIILSIINILLIVLVWMIMKSFAENDSKGEIMGPLRGISRSLEEKNRAVDDIKDQIWGVLDRLKEIENKTGRIEENSRFLSACNSPEEMEEELRKWTENKKGQLNDLLGEIENFRQSVSSINNDFESLRRIQTLFENVESNISALNQYLKKT
jgi:predicted  nucleic acid-binding Zn-ribbon protein